MSTKIVGRDVTVYSLAFMDQNGNGGAVQSMLGRWESLELTIEKEWSDLTPSDADEPEMRRTVEKWNASAKSFIDGSGSTALLLALNGNDYVLCVFTDVMSGRTITLRGGIDKSSASFNQDNAKDTLDFSSKGKFGSTPSLVYA